MASCSVCKGSLRLLDSICPLCDGVAGWPEDVFTPSIPRGTIRGNGFSILSWNILNKDTIGLETVDNPHYNHLKDSERFWAYRFPRIVEELKRSEATIICLQEVNAGDYDDIKQTMTAVGYNVVTQKRMQRNSLAICFKQPFQQVWLQNKRSKTLAVGLTDGSRTIAVVTCHLEGNPSKGADRLDQLQKALSEITDSPHNAVVVAGDFNAPLAENGTKCSAVTSYMATGRVAAEVTEWGHAVVSTVQPHGYHFSSAYPASAASICLHGEGASLIDHMWYSRGVQLTGVRDVFFNDVFRENVLSQGLPTEENASDHLPLAATFQWS